MADTVTVRCPVCHDEQEGPLGAYMSEGWPACHDQTMVLTELPLLGDDGLIDLVLSGGVYSSEPHERNLLHVAADEFNLPLELATEAIALMGVRGSGKSHGSCVFVEELSYAGVQTVVIDPVGVWWGVRLDHDGKRNGLNHLVLGGRHGDAKLHYRRGAEVGALAVRDNVNMVLDLSLMSRTQQAIFVADFCEYVYRYVERPIHIVIDECDSYASQKPRPALVRSLDAMEDLVRRGRAKGVGCTLISQRPASVNKDVLSQATVLFAFETPGPHDHKAIMDWVKSKGVSSKLDVMKSSLASQPVGTAWVWSPRFKLFAQVRIRQKHTYDSSDTPKVRGPVRKRPKLPEIDFEHLADKVEKVGRPKDIPEQIRELEEKLEALRALLPAG